MNLFAELFHSIYDLKSYSTFIKDRKRKTFLFGFLLVLLYYLFTIVIPYGKFYLSTGGPINILDQLMPDFTVVNNTVSVSHPIEYELYGTYIFVNTEDCYLEESVIQSYLRNYSQVVILDSEKMIIKSTTQYNYIFYSELDPDLYLTKTLLLEMIRPYVAGIIAAVLVLIFLGMELIFFFGVLFVALLGMIAASCMQYKLTFGELYKLGIYTRTTPLILKAVIAILPIKVPLYFLISIGISLAYLVGAIRHMKIPPKEDQMLSFYSHETKPQEDRDLTL